jgi:hypothetical protein
MAVTPNTANSSVALRRRHEPPDLRVSNNVFSDDIVRFIIDEWLVPTMVDEFLRTKTLRKKVEEGHNGSPFP